MFVGRAGSGPDIVTDFETADSLLLYDGTGMMALPAQISITTDGPDATVLVDGTAVLSRLGQTSTNLGDYSVA